MADRDEQQILEFVPKFEYRKFVADSKKGYRALQREQLLTTKLNKKLSEGVGKTAKAYTKWEREVKKLGYAADLSTLLNQTEDLAELQERLTDETGETAKATQEEIEKLEKRYDMAVKGADRYAKTLLTVKKAAADLREEEEQRKFRKIAETAGYGGRQAGEEIAEGFANAMSSIPSRDLAGFARGFAQQLGSAGKYLKGAGMRMAAKGAAEPGGGGAMAKGIGAVMKGVGPLLEGLAKMGPLLTVASGALMAIVKFFLDADAAAKDFNKDVLATAGTTGFLDRNMGNVAAGAEDLKHTLQGMYTQASALDNLQWGISKETHAQVTSALTAEGVAIDKIAGYFEDVKKGASEAQGYVKDWGSMVQMSVAYSRAFGVSLGEITQFQGEMMSEMGMNFAMVQNSFQTILDGARDSGIAANKFFGIIRGVSSDLSLFNLRMADAAKLLGQVGKVMSPRNAQQFMQTITHMFKGMGLIERTKSSLLAGGGGGKTRGILTKDLESKIEGLAGDIDLKLGKGMGKKLKEAIKKPKDLMRFMAENAKDLDGSTREALLEASRMSGKLAKGGLVDVASALKDASPMAAIDQLDAISKNMFRKPFEDLTDVQRIAFENLTGVGDEQVDQLSKFKSSLDLTKATLVNKLKEGIDLTQDEADLIKKLGIDTTKGDRADQLDKIDSRKIWDTMSKTQQDLLAESSKTIDWGKRTGENTQSMVDKLGVIMDWLMNKLYNVMIGIWDTISSFPGLKGGDSRRMEIALAKTKNKDLMDAFEKAGKDKNKFRDEALKTNLGQSFAKNINTAPVAEIMDKHFAALGKDMTVANNKFNVMTQAMTDAKIDQAKISDVITKWVSSPDMNATDALDKAGLSKEEIGNVLGKAAAWHFDPTEFAKILDDYSKSGKATGADTAQTSTAVAAGAPPSEQTATSDDVQKAAETQATSTTNALDDLTRNVRQQSHGIVLNKSYLKNQYGSQIEDSVYSAVSQALFEQWLTEQAGQETILSALSKGANRRDIVAAAVGAVRAGSDSPGGLEGIKGAINKLPVPGMAAGGVVPQPKSPDSVFVAAKPGETILPRGAAGSGGEFKVVLELKGDMLKQIIRAQALNTINDHDRARKQR